MNRPFQSNLRGECYSYYMVAVEPDSLNKIFPDAVSCILKEYIHNAKLFWCSLPPQYSICFEYLVMLSDVVSEMQPNVLLNCSRFIYLITINCKFTRKDTLLVLTNRVRPCMVHVQIICIFAWNRWSMHVPYMVRHGKYRIHMIMHGKFRFNMVMHVNPREVSTGFPHVQKACL